MRRMTRALLSVTSSVSFDVSTSLSGAGYTDADDWSSAVASTLSNSSYASSLEQSLGVNVSVSSVASSVITRSPTPAPTTAKPTDVSAPAPAPAPADSPVDSPADSPVDSPADSPVDSPADSPTEASAPSPNSATNEDDSSAETTSSTAIELVVAGAVAAVVAAMVVVWRRRLRKGAPIQAEGVRPAGSWLGRLFSSIFGGIPGRPLETKVSPTDAVEPEEQGEAEEQDYNAADAAAAATQPASLDRKDRPPNEGVGLARRPGEPIRLEPLKHTDLSKNLVALPKEPILSPQREEFGEAKGGRSGSDKVHILDGSEYLLESEGGAADPRKLSESGGASEESGGPELLKRSELEDDDAAAAPLVTARQPSSRRKKRAPPSSAPPPGHVALYGERELDAGAEGIHRRGLERLNTEYLNDDDRANNDSTGTLEGIYQRGDIERPDDSLHLDDDVVGGGGGGGSGDSSGGDGGD